MSGFLERLIGGLALVVLCASTSIVQADEDKLLKPFILGNSLPGNMAQVTAKVKTALQANGFTVVGSYTPFKGATVICATNAQLKAAAAKAHNGGFGVAQRISVTEFNGQLQVAYANPEYVGTAYGLGNLQAVSAKMKAALGAVKEFGAKGVKSKKLAPGQYHYAMFMPFFRDVSKLNKFPDHRAALETVSKNLAVGKGGTVQVYRIDLPGKEVSVFGVGIVAGDGPDKGKKDTDKEILDIIDFHDIRSTAYLPYEIMVAGKQVIALRGRYRIAVHFPDTKMAGKHGFTKIMSSPGGIKKALEAVAGYK